MAIYCFSDEAVFIRPQLMSLFVNGRNDIATAAIHALAGQATHAAPELIPHLNHTNSWKQFCSVWLLAQAGTNALQLIEHLEPMVYSTNTSLQQISLWALSEIDIETDFSVNAFSNAIISTNSSVSNFAIGKVEQSPFAFESRTNILRAIYPEASATVQSKLDATLTRMNRSRKNERR